MGQYRERFERDLQIRGFSSNTVKQYVYCVRKLVKHFMRPPNELTIDDINEFQLHLTKERGGAWSTFNIYVFAIRMFFLQTLKKDWDIAAIPYQKTGRKLPEVLSGTELKVLFKAATNIKHRAILLATYSAGLRVSEVVHLQVSGARRPQRRRATRERSEPERLEPEAIDPSTRGPGIIQG